MRGAAVARAAVLTLAVAVTSTGCGILAPDGDDALTRLERAEALWAARGPERYAVTVTRSCECLWVEPRLTVQDGAIVAVDFPSGTDPIYPESEWRQIVLATHYPVEGFFAYLRQVLAGDPYSFSAEYDPANGLPLVVSVDHRREVADDEWVVRYTDLELLTAGSS